jgi:hypothetical protein
MDQVASSGQQRQDAVDIVVSQRGRIARPEPALAFIAERRERGLLAAFGESVLDQPAGALQRGSR